MNLFDLYCDVMYCALFVFIRGTTGLGFGFHNELEMLVGSKEQMNEIHQFQREGPVVSIGA